MNKKSWCLFLIITLLNICHADTSLVSTALKERRVYKTKQAVDQCPPIVRIQESDPNYYKVTKSGDKHVTLWGLRPVANGGALVFDTFAHEKNRFIFRESLKPGQSAKVSGNCDMSVIGGGCNGEKQIVKKDYVKFESSAKVVSVIMMAFGKRELTFSSNGNITYLYKGNGIPDVKCEYEPAPELTDAADSYEKKLSENDSNRDSYTKDSLLENNPSTDSSKATPQ